MLHYVNNIVVFFCICLKTNWINLKSLCMIFVCEGFMLRQTFRVLSTFLSTARNDCSEADDTCFIQNKQTLQMILLLIQEFCFFLSCIVSIPK